MGTVIRSVRALRWAILAAVASVVLTACAGSDTVADPATDNASPAAAPVRANYQVSPWGVRIGIRVGFDEARTVTGARMLWRGDSQEIEFYPDDGSDPEAQLEQMRVEPGQRPSYDATILMTCPITDSGLPVIEIVSTVDGEERRDRYAPDDPGDLDDAFAQWCEQGVTLTMDGWSLTPAGEYTATAVIGNPGPDTVDIVSEEVEDSGITWDRATVRAEPGARTKLVITGRGPEQCPGPGPWETGHVLADGVPIDVPNWVASTANEPC